MLPIKSFDIIGSREKAVAIVEIPEEFESRKKEIAEEIMRLHKNVRSVLRKISERKGIYRVRDYELLAGEEDTEVIHKEYGYLLKLDPRKVYFSPREATERQRIAKKVNPGENVLVMFSGIAPFAIAIAKAQPYVRKVYAVEINTIAHSYALENVRINKLSHKVIPLLGDVREICKSFFGKCERVVMPLPLGGEKYLDLAIKCLKEEGVIHFYHYGNENDLFSQALKVIEENVKNLGKKFEVLEKRKVLPYKPKVFKICIDFKVY